MSKFIAHYREKDGTPQFVEEHLIGVSRLAGNFASKIGLKKHGELIGLLHDLGKLSNAFNDYIKSRVGLLDEYEEYDEGKKLDHATAGAQTVYEHYAAEKGTAHVSQILSIAIASHHTGLMDCLTPAGIDNYTVRMNKADEKTRARECMSNLGNIDIHVKLEQLLNDKEIPEGLNQKLVSMKDGNDSDETRMLKFGLLARFLFSCLIDADRLDTADFECPGFAELRNQGNYAPWANLAGKLEKHLEKLNGPDAANSVPSPGAKRVNDIRSEISKCCYDFATSPKGIYQLTVPTGGGKTLSSLRFALNYANKHRDSIERIIYVIPYTSIIEQNAETVRAILEKGGSPDARGSIVLEHHSNLTPEKETMRQKLLSENWDAPTC